ncbi:YdcF family protein, partial [Pseudomonas gingeri]|nr:YdcF family protein [Pseudomonas gingeri]
MPVRFILKQLLLPPGLLLLLLALAWWFRRRRPRLAGLCFALGLGGFWLISLPVVVEWSARVLETVPPLQRDEWAGLAQRADAIVVLGSGRERGDPAWG